MLWLTTLAAAALTAVAGLSVGASRQLRELGLLAANGAGRWQLRTMVLLQGVGLGLLGGVAGILGGLAATWVAFPIMRGWLTPVTDEHFTVLVPQFSVRASDLRWVLAFTAAVALLAALGPARRAARLPAQAALAGRDQQPRRRRRLVLLGAALTLAGIAEQVLVGYVNYYGEVAPLPLQLVFGGRRRHDHRGAGGRAGRRRPSRPGAGRCRRPPPPAAADGPATGRPRRRQAAGP